MASIGFYHLTRTRLDQALPALLSKTMKIKQHALVLCKDDQHVITLSEALWDNASLLWLPHGCHTSNRLDDMPLWQPIWLSIYEENVNEANYVFLVGGQCLQNIGPHQRIFDLFDGMDAQSIQLARERWSILKAQNHALSYWKQGDKGWVKE
ncbi:hypothetical protein COMNV_00208 [Commensalibacter sp. Nvir]|uniref:DNA polymerase III subunit chi n=1 Tax=Commensalibacter sp. Nvir TaxID=3069817 RepID=UPI002D39A01D|nr:hypothetical protein COMNV_00208 [Commensalibacter sp. Nvir]